MDTEDVEQKKRKYLKENIIEKGYNPEELSKYIVKMYGNTGAHLNFDQYAAIVEKFKNEQFKNAYIEANDPNVTTDLKSSEFIYRDFKKEVKCGAPVVTPLHALEQKKEQIKIIVKDPKKVEGRFFSKSYYTFVISCPIIQLEERRTQDDIEWFRNKLIENYYFNFIPPLTSVNYYKDPDNIQNTLKDIQNFFNEVCRKKILRTSELLYYFISLDEKSFATYKDKVNKTPVKPFQSYSTVKGLIYSEINKDKVKFANNIYPNLQTAFPFYEKIFSILNSITECYSALEKHFSDLSGVFSSFEKIEKNLKTREVTKKFNVHFQELFTVISHSYKAQGSFYNHELREYFARSYNDFKAFDILSNKFKEIKGIYEKINDKLVDKKESLFNSKNFAKWDLEPGYEVDYLNIESNKRKIFEKMCYKENEELDSVRLKVGFALNYYTKEYLKVCKYQAERALSFSEYMESQKKIMLGDCYNIIDLFTIKL